MLFVLTTDVLEIVNGFTKAAIVIFGCCEFGTEFANLKERNQNKCIFTIKMSNMLLLHQSCNDGTSLQQELPVRKQHMPQRCLICYDNISHARTEQVYKNDP